MPGPRSRAELVDGIRTSFEKLALDLDAGGRSVGSLDCVDDWSVKDLLAVRLWWTERVGDWVEAGTRGECPVTPAEGYRWKETPRLNADVVRRERRASYRAIRARLAAGVERVLALVEELDDDELLEPRRFEWAGTYPVARWIAMNTTRQYTTARTLVRKALRAT